jgi:hypothetical protein
VNTSVRRFHTYAMERDKAISREEFIQIFWDESPPFIIEKCCDFTQNLRGIAERAGIPVIYLTQEICGSVVDISSDGPNAQYAKSFKSINTSYRRIAHSLLQL